MRKSELRNCAGRGPETPAVILQLGEGLQLLGVGLQLLKAGLQLLGLGLGVPAKARPENKANAAGDKDREKKPGP